MPIDKQQRVLPWWRVNANGSYVLFECNRRSVARQGSFPLVIDIPMRRATANWTITGDCAEVPQDCVILKSGTDTNDPFMSRTRRGQLVVTA